LIPSHVLTLLCRKPDLVGVIILLKDILSSADAAVKGAFADFTGEGANRQTSAKIEEWQRGLEDFKKRICTAARVLAVVVKNEPPSRERFYRCRNVLCRMVGQLIVLVGEVDGYMKRAVQPLLEVEESEAEREFQEELARVLSPPTPRSQREDYRKEIGASQGKKTDSQIFHKEQIERQTSALQSAVLKLSASDNKVNLHNSNNNGVAIQYEQRIEKLTVIHLPRGEGANEKEEDGVFHLEDNEGKQKDEGTSLKKKKSKKNKKKNKKRKVKKEGKAGQERERRNKNRRLTDIEPMGLEEIPVQPHHDNDFSPPDNEAEPTSTKSPRPKQRRRPCLIA